MILLLAQGLGVGKIPRAPGTFGSVLGLVWLGLLLQTGNYWCYLAGMLGGIAASVFLCGAAEVILKQTDPPSVVLDEIVAIPLCFLPWLTRDWLAHDTLPSLATFWTGKNALGT